MTKDHIRGTDGLGLGSSVSAFPSASPTSRHHGGGGRAAPAPVSFNSRSLLACLVSAAALLSSFPFALVHLGGGGGGNQAKRDALDGHIVLRSRDDEFGTPRPPLPLSKNNNDQPVDAKKADGFSSIVAEEDSDSVSLGEHPGLWSNSTVLPRWMKDYFDWHRRTRRNDELKSSRHDGGGGDDDDGTRYLVVQCLAEFGKCGGLADRLKPMAFYVMYANQTRRVLLIRWTRPCPLEEFLVPPAGGVDWRVPPSLEGRIPNKSTFKGAHQARWQKKSNSTILTATLQSPDGGEMMFNEHAPEGHRFADVFGEMFRCMFELSPPLADGVRSTMDRLGLVPGRYGTAHVRARYPTHWLQHRSVRDGAEAAVSDAKVIDKDGGVAFEGRARRTMIDIGINAVTCAANLLSPSSVPRGETDVVVYFASDSHELTTYLLRDPGSPFSPTVDGERSLNATTTATAAAEKKVKLSALERTDEPLHLDTTTWRNHTPADFYPAFEDLWILGLGRCTSFGMGGYGRFGLALSTNSTCKFNHRNYRGRIQRCGRPHWLDKGEEKKASAG